MQTFISSWAKRIVPLCFSKTGHTIQYRTTVSHSTLKNLFPSPWKKQLDLFKMSICFQVLGGEDEGNTKLLKHKAALFSGAGNISLLAAK